MPDDSNVNEVTLDPNAIARYAEYIRWTVVSIARGSSPDFPFKSWTRMMCHMFAHHYDGDLRETFLQTLKKGCGLASDGRFSMIELLELHGYPTDQLESIEDYNEHIFTNLPKSLTCSREALARWSVLFILDTFAYASKLEGMYDQERIVKLFTSHDPNDVYVTFSFCRYAVFVAICAMDGHPLPVWTKRDWANCDEATKPLSHWDKNPVHQGRDGHWYFWDPEWEDEKGPFETESDAMKACLRYAETL